MRSLVFLLVLVSALAGCGGDDGTSDDAAAKVGVVTAFYPLAEAARQVGGDLVTVTDLTPPGVEPHDLEISPGDVEDIEDADVVLLMGNDFQPGVEAAAARADGAVEVLDALAVDDGDVHVWLDPQQMRAILEVVVRALADADPDNEAAYEANASRYGAEIGAVDTEFSEGLADCERRTIVTAHDAFGWLARRYDLEQQAIAGISPDAEPDADRLAELADLAREQGVTTIFSEELVPPDIAETVAREAGGLRTEVLNPIEGLTEEQRDAGDDYLSLMRDNLTKLQEALGCA
ncbi:MAG: zinc ABC transporter substrate-binding protein [Actinomycetota bacterium]|nr:zinc ABC transporter substrate-binding protein [Actinomycetota bacterium]